MLTGRAGDLLPRLADSRAQVQNRRVEGQFTGLAYGRPVWEEIYLMAGWPC